MPKNWCFWTVVLEKTLESPLDSKEIKPVHLKGNQPLTFIGRTDAEVETPILWPPDGKNGLIGQDTDAGQDWRQQEKGTIEDEMVGWHHQLNGHESEQALGVGDGQGSAAVHRVPKSQTWLSDWTELNWWHVYVIWEEKHACCAVWSVGVDGLKNTSVLFQGVIFLQCLSLMICIWCFIHWVLCLFSLDPQISPVSSLPSISFLLQTLH